jgi:hypothetical protein
MSVEKVSYDGFYATTVGRPHAGWLDCCPECLDKLAVSVE